MDRKESSRLRRTLHEMPEYVRVALEESKLMEAYRERPPY